MDCRNLDTCPFFLNRMKSMPATAELMKNRYCKDDYSSCARYLVSSTVGKKLVPEDLYPNQHERARRIIAEQNS